MKKLTVLLLLLMLIAEVFADTGRWMMFETLFKSKKEYANPLYDLKYFRIVFRSPSGRVKNMNGFWDGGLDFKVRICPDETGAWTYTTSCSDTSNSGLHGISGSFQCVPNDSPFELYQKGAIIHPPGEYYLAHADGAPFFWTACTAWNGALLSTDAEWDKYLKQRADHGYTVIQFVTTQWRGGVTNSQGQTAFTGSGRIDLNVEFFRRLDAKIKRINDYGLVASPVLLWALQAGQGREYNPGYYLPDNEAILLARYMVARYGSYHVIWTLGGDGKYTDEYEQRWKNIGRGVFGDEHPGIVTTHPMGRSWPGKVLCDEQWLDFYGYQSSHSTGRGTVDWINKGPMAEQWDKLPPRPYINMEPNYEEIGLTITDKDVRNASYWSLFATPIAGITYGANGIWPWLRPGEVTQNHRHIEGTSTWDKSIDLPGSLQIGYLAGFIRSLEWWRFRPAPELLVSQPGDSVYNHFISVVRTRNSDQVLAYTPVRQEIEFYNVNENKYTGKWFDPVNNKYRDAEIRYRDKHLLCIPPAEGDWVLLLNKI